jgi:hypothetical protein
MGDQDGDGADDLFVVGTDRYYGSYYGTHAGALFFGGFGVFDGDMSEDDADVFFEGTESSYFYVKALSDIDFDGDGNDDIFLGDYYYDGETEGSVYYFSSADISAGGTYDLSDDSNSTITGDSEGDFFGYTLGGGDLDYDGYDDLISASAAEDVGGLDRAGCAYIIEGTASLPSGSASVGWAADTSICGDSESGRLGRHAVPQLIDVDGDLAMDIVIGAPGDEFSGTDGSGKVYIFFNDGDLSGSLSTADADVTLTSGDANSFGYALHSGDFDGDGSMELAVGAPDTVTDESDLDDPGEVFIFRIATLAAGGTISADDADLSMVGDGATQFGSSMSSADFDGDGAEELIVSSPRWEDQAGRISIFSLN